MTTPAAEPHAQSQPATAPAEPTVIERVVTGSDTTVAKLSNGLTVIAKATRQAPVVCVRAYVRAGGLYEQQWLGAGISHLTEHLVAKGAVHDMGEGATDQAVSQTTGRVKEIGGQSNAYTSLDHTCYYISAAAGKTDECIDLIADWMARPSITEEDFHREHGVVQRELEMGMDDPGRQMWRAHAANFFSGHPAAVPVIGYRAPLRKLTRQDVLAYHRRMYVPQNMIFAVVGDIDVEQVLQRVCRGFAGLPQGLDARPALPAVPAISGVRRVVRPHKTLEEAVQRISFRTIPLIHEDLFALDVLSYVLTKGQASRLVRTVQRDRKLVTSIDSSSWTPAWGAGMFTVSFRADLDKADAAEQVVLDELRSIVADGVDVDELARAKRQKLADLVYSQQTVESVADRLAGDYLSTGDAAFSDRYTACIQAVTAEDVRAAAAKYFTFGSVVITRMVPPTPATAPTGQATDDASEAGTSAFTLPNGLRVVLRATDAVGLVSMALVNRGGVLLEDDATNGMGTLMTALATKGAGGRSAQEIAKFFDQAGGSVAGKCGNNTFYWQGTVLADSYLDALDILADIVIRPTFPAEELEILRPVIEASIRRQDDHWHGQLSKFFRGKFFTNSPYRLMSVGNLDVLAGATSQSLAAYHKASVKAGSAVLTVYGNFNPVETRQCIEQAFADMPAGDTTLPSPSPRSVEDELERHELKTENEVAGIIVAAPGMKIDDVEDRFAMDVLDTIISGWSLPSGWLHSELRGKRLVYVVHAYNWAGLAPGAFVVYAACQPDKAEQVEDIITGKLRKAAGYTPTQEEIDLAVNTILTAELLDNQAMSSLALSAALDELYGFGYDFRRRMEKRYRSITPADVLRVGKKYLAGGYVVVVTSPQEQVMPPAAEDAGADGE